MSLMPIPRWCLGCRVSFCYYVHECGLLWLNCQYLPPFRLAASVLWCRSWEKEGRTIDGVPGIYAVHWKLSMCTASRTSSYSPVKPSVFFYMFSLGLCFACLFVLFDLFLFWFVCVFNFCVPLGSWVIPLTVFGASVTNLNEPPRVLATSTIMWVRS